MQSKPALPFFRFPEVVSTRCLYGSKYTESPLIFKKRFTDFWWQFNFVLLTKEII